METFETYRPYLFGIAYRMLGSAMDAEDMVQETYLRYQATPKDAIRSPKALLTTIITRLCMDQLQLARRQREQYIGPWLPEPLLTGPAAEAEPGDPAEKVETDESISLAFLLLLEELQPIERAVFLLREVFDYDYAEIASFLGKSEAACRQWFSRAKKHLADHRPRFPSSPETHQQLLTTFFHAVQDGEMAPLMEVLSEDVTLWADSGGNVRGAALKPIVGREGVMRYATGTRRFLPEGYRVEMAPVNGQPAVIVRGGERAFLILTIEVEAGLIQTIRVIGNPDKLARI